METNWSAMRKGDIILTASNSLQSSAIKGVIGTDFSHVMMYLGDERVVEAVWPVVQIHNYRIAMHEVRQAIVLRRKNMNSEQRSAVVEIAKSFVGRRYDAVGAAGAGIMENRSILLLRGLLIIPIGAAAVALMSGMVIGNSLPFTKDARFFCSELIARSYELIGKPLYDHLSPSLVNPRDVRTSSKLIYVGHLDV